MPTDYGGAVLRWREHIEKQPGGLAQFDRSATVSTMLFACGRYLETASNDPVLAGERARIEAIRDELQAWMLERQLSYTG